jgi:hypothetical protein
MYPDRKARRRAAVVAAAGVIVALPGCARQNTAVPVSFTPAATPKSDPAVPPPWTGAQDRAWMHAHPAPARADMTAGIVSSNYRIGVGQIPCRNGRGSRGEPGMCSYWAVTVVTATGTIKAACGNKVTYCSSLAYPAEGNPKSEVPADDHDFPVPGDYLYVPDNGQVVPGHDVKVIRRMAIPGA